MKVKRILCLLLVLLCPCAALADGESFASYRLPAEAKTVIVSDIRTLEVPEGLEAMYSAMGRVSISGDTYIVQMKNGLALASVSWRPLRSEVTLEDLLAMKPQIQAALYQDFAYVQEEGAAFEITTRFFGRETLAVYALVGEEKPEEFRIVGTTFPADGVMYEIWIIAPVDETLPGLASDMADMEFFIDSVEFTVEAADSASYHLIDGQLAAMELPENQLYTDAANRFCAGFPLDSRILTPQSSAEEREAIRQEYLSQNPSGAERVFEQLMEDVDTENATVVFCNGFQNVAEFFCENVPEMADMNTADFLSMGDGIAQSLMGDYDLALCLSTNEAVTLSGREHCLLRFGIRTDELSQYLTVLACIDEHGLLREIDLLTPAQQGQTGADALLSLIVQTLQYQ